MRAFLRQDLTVSNIVPDRAYLCRYGPSVDTSWVALMGGAIGVVGTLGATAFNQWRSDVREAKRRDDERERERASRLFDHRREAYSAVLQHYYCWEVIASELSRDEVPEPPEDAMSDFWSALGEVDLYGSHKTASSARNLYFAMSNLIYGGLGSDPEPDWTAMDRFRDFVTAARLDLGVPATKPPTPVQKWAGMGDANAESTGEHLTVPRTPDQEPARPR